MPETDAPEGLPPGKGFLSLAGKKRGRGTGLGFKSPITALHLNPAGPSSNGRLEMGDPTDSGVSTLPERLARVVRLPYPVGCLIFALLAGGPGLFLLFYLNSFDFSYAFGRTVAASVLAVTPVRAQVPAGLGLLEICESTLALFADLYLIGYLRRRIVAERTRLSELLPDGARVYDRAFGLVSSTTGPLLLGLLFFALYFPARTALATGPLSLTGMVLVTALANGVYGAAFWVYVSALWGVYTFGAKPLRLKNFLEDRVLGVRPLGQLVVSFALVFSLAITLTLAGSIVAGDSISIAINFAIVVGGVAMLFVPLTNLHRRMVESKEREEGILRLRFKESLKGVAAPHATQDDVRSRDRTQELTELQTYLTLKEAVSKIPEWPFESRSVERVVAVLLVILTVLLTRLLTL